MPLPPVMIRVLEVVPNTNYPQWVAILPNSNPPMYYVFNGDSLMEQNQMIQTLAKLMRAGDNVALETELPSILKLPDGINGVTAELDLFGTTNSLLYADAPLIMTAEDGNNLVLIVDALAEVGSKFLELLAG